MKSIKNLSSNYIIRINKLNKVKISRKQLSNFYSALRLIFFIACIIFFIYTYKINSYKLTVLSIVIFIIGIFYLSKKHGEIKLKISKIQALIDINEIAEKRRNNEFKDLDNGNDLLDKTHNYSEDLDILGNSSIFQKICSAITPYGRLRLKYELCGDVDFTLTEIKERQVAIEELSKKTFFSQRFISEGMVSTKGFKDPAPLIKWGNEYDKEAFNPLNMLLPKIMGPLAALSILIPLFITNLTFLPAKIICAFNICLLLINIGKRNTLLDKVFEFKTDIESYASMISYLEKANFETSYLKKFQEKLIATDGARLKDQINELNKIAHRISDRRNIFYFPLNIILLWDYKVYYDLENFKKHYGRNLETMIKVIAELEALISLSNINRDNPNWCIPSVNDNNLVIEAIGISHPLLDSKAVSNNVCFNPNNQILLITGSNMAGKSTLLRTVGINLVLAYTGAKVRATDFTCTKMKIFTCMRTKDNLEESISSFYAEIIRIKALINLTNKNEKVFFLLDEIFKGTNSMDRHIGAKILINQLSRAKTLGMVSTHDLELGEIYKSSTNIKNFHLKEYYKDNEILFDYKLRPGVSDTRNALYLMRMAGIEI